MSCIIVLPSMLKYSTALNDNFILKIHRKYFKVLFKKSILRLSNKEDKSKVFFGRYVLEMVLDYVKNIYSTFRIYLL